MLDSWKEIRLAVWDKRPQGAPAQPWEWTTRQPPKPSAVAVLVALADSETFADKWRSWSVNLGVTDPTQLTVLADGAEWIWKQAEIQFPKAAGVLDFYHAVEHLAGTAKELFGSRPGAEQAWLDVGRNWLLSEGWAGARRWIGAVRRECGQSAASIEATEQLLQYFAKHTAHMNYKERLAQGRTIGSGAVEGAVKQLVSKRLKQTRAQWRPENAVRMATLCSTRLADDWGAHWADACLNLGA